MKNILIPTDFSENSWNALKYAVSFFKKINCNFYLVHVTPSDETVAANSIVGAIRKTTDTTEEKFNSLFRKIEKLPLNPKHQFFRITDSMFFVDSIRRQIKEKNIDYIVMGTKGASGLKEKTVGSNTGDVITKVKCPVLVIPEGASYVRPKEIAFPTDYNIYYKERVLKTLTDVLSMNNASLSTLYISKTATELTNLQNQHKEFLDAYFEDSISHNFNMLTDQNLEEALQNFVESRNISMITMIAKNLNFFQRILFHPTIEKISYHTSVPFLVLHE